MNNTPKRVRHPCSQSHQRELKCGSDSPSLHAKRKASDGARKTSLDQVTQQCLRSGLMTYTLYHEKIQIWFMYVHECIRRHGNMAILNDLWNVCALLQEPGEDCQREDIHQEREQRCIARTQIKCHYVWISLVVKTLRSTTNYVVCCCLKGRRRHRIRNSWLRPQKIICCERSTCRHGGIQGGNLSKTNHITGCQNVR